MKLPSKLAKLLKKFKKDSQSMTGYPLNQHFEYSFLAPFLNLHINNLGDPFGVCWNYKINTLKEEKEVLQRFAKLFHAPSQDYWGYVTTGGTEGNLYGLFLARERFPDGVVYYSDQTHYSVPKCLMMLRMEGVKIPSLHNGEIDYLSLQKHIASQSKPVIIFANIGTTMRGAVDNVPKIQKILKEASVKQHYIHCDAAFFGMILPFVKGAKCEEYDFRAGVDSLVISGHKMIGTPVPCGVVVAKKSHVESIGNHIEYVGTRDSTITGSRNGLTPLFLWHAYSPARKAYFVKTIKQCLENAEYAIECFRKYNIDAWRNPHSMIVVFPRPGIKTIKKWQISVQEEIAHVITLPQVNRKVIQALVKDVALDLKRRR